MLEKSQSFSESQMAEACRAKDPKMQRYVFEKFYGAMMGICLRYAPNREEARDMMQEGFVKVFNKIEQYNSEYSFIGWMKRIMVNNAIDQYRKNARMPMTDNELILENESVSEDVFSGMGYKEIIALIQRLPNGYRTVFNMYVIEGYNHKEIAQKLGIAEGTSKSQLNKAKHLLRKKIEKLNLI